MREVEVTDGRIKFSKREKEALEGVVNAKGTGDFLGDGSSTSASFKIDGKFKLQKAGHLACEKILD